MTYQLTRYICAFAAMLGVFFPIAVSAELSLEGCPTDSAGVIQYVDRIKNEESAAVRYDIGLRLTECIMNLMEISRSEVFDDQAVDAIVSLLPDRNDGVDGFAAASLGYIGPRAARAIPALERALAHAEEEEASNVSFGFHGNVRIIRAALSKIQAPVSDARE